MVMTRILTPLVAAGLLAVGASAAEAPRLEEEPVPDPASDPGSAEDQGWGIRVDETYDVVSSRVESTARWLDGFFGSERAEVEANFSYLRLRPRIALDDEDGLQADVRVSGRLDLPQSRRRLALIAAGERDEDDPLNLVDANVERNLLDDRERNDASFGLQWVLDDDDRYHTSISGTIKSGGHPQLAFRVRRAFHNRDRNLFGLVTTRPYWNSRDGLGLRLDGQLNRTLGQHSLLRLLGSVESWQDREGWEWQTGAQVYRRLESRAVVAFSVLAQGESEPEWRPELWTVGPLYRQSFHRPWIFFSVQPFVRWRTPLLEDTRRDHGILLELDLFFGERNRDRDRSAEG